MDPTPATITAVTALVVAAVTFAFSVVRWRDERAARVEAMKKQDERWHTDFANERQKWDAELQVQFLHDIVSQRLKYYPDVLRLLGMVRDADPDGAHYRELEEHRDQLRHTAEALLSHLYGEAGLVMSMDTRNSVVAVRAASLRFAQGGNDPEALADIFFEARRQLRSDLQIRDFRGILIGLDEISGKTSSEK